MIRGHFVFTPGPTTSTGPPDMISNFKIADLVLALAGILKLLKHLAEVFHCNSFSANRSLTVSRTRSGKKAPTTRVARTGSASDNVAIASPNAACPPASYALFSLLISAQSASVRPLVSTTSNIIGCFAISTVYRETPGKPNAGSATTPWWRLLIKHLKSLCRLAIRAASQLAASSCACLARDASASSAKKPAVGGGPRLG
jgi:hypothetical protein